MNGNQAGTLMMDRMLSMRTEWVAGMMDPNPSMENSTEHTQHMASTKLKLNKAINENSSFSYRASPAIWDHTVLPATRHKWTCSTLTPASKPVLDFPTLEGWKGWVDLGYPAMHWPGVKLTTSRSQVRRPTTTLLSQVLCHNTALNTFLQ